MHHGSAEAWLSQVVKGGLSVVIDGLGLRRNIVVLSLAIFCVGLGEELWARFLPKYLEALGAGVLAIGAFGTFQELLEGLYPYPGGVLADRWGRKRALVAFNLLALVGYGIYLVSPSWPFVFVGLGFTMAWSSLALPATFALIGDNLPPERRAMGFTVQSILKRVPTVLAPPLGGLLIGSLGLVAGMHVGLAATLVLATLSLLAQHRFYVEAPVAARPASMALRDTLRALPAGLKHLLVAESIVRTGQGLAEIFVVLYVINVLGLTAATFGTLVALRMATSILVYIPVAALADRWGRTPFVVLSFRVLRPLPLPAGERSGTCGTHRGVCVRRTTGNRGTGAQGHDRRSGRRRPARADGRSVLFHARPRGDAGKPGWGYALEAGSPDPLLCRGRCLSPGAGTAVGRQTLRNGIH